MTRRKIINKDLVLDIAQNLILNKGIKAFTLQSLAQKCGITKGGLQYCFGSKDQLIDTLITRWENNFAKRFSELKEKKHFSPLRSYAELTKLVISRDNARAPAMLATMLQTTKRLNRSKKWIADRINDFSVSENQEQHYNNMMFFFALEGLHLMKNFGFLKLDNKSYKKIIDHIIHCIEKNSKNNF